MTAPVLIQTASMAERMRARIVRPKSGEILIARIEGSAQEDDLTLPPNCGGMGRVRHFRRDTAPGWPDNPLPIEPAARALGLAPDAIMRAQVFQNAACAWRCWYCYVPFDLLGGDERLGRWMTAPELVALFAAEQDRPSILDLSGGSPDLTPEWIVWTMDALADAGLARSVYLWSDDNLSTDFMFSKLDERERARLASNPRYGRVCCFKGANAEAFVFNTGAGEDGFAQQFALFARYLEIGLDLYGYVTLTGPEGSASAVSSFVDRLQAIHSNLPLRVVPLQILPFGPMLARRSTEHRIAALAEQETAVAIWNSELAKRFDPSVRAESIASVSLA